MVSPNRRALRIAVERAMTRRSSMLTRSPSSDEGRLLPSDRGILMGRGAFNKLWRADSETAVRVLRGGHVEPGPRAMSRRISTTDLCLATSLDPA